jgi:shikimate kinase
MHQRSLSIALVGMPGSGKSTVGRQLARNLGCRFADSDTELEHTLGCPVRRYFEQHGEPAFRDAEQQVISRLSQETGLVLATGGGSVLRAANRQALAEHCVVVYLKSSPEDLYRRLRHDTQRPLLQVADPLRRLRELYRERDPLYRRSAHFVVEAARPSVPALIGMVLMQLELAGLVDPSRVPSAVSEPALQNPANPQVLGSPEAPT